ncbi:2-C-methyl-D-erythritol 4-phosphate cytidylyltransferase [Halieaceae bacterium IMCC14734]|uniref:2-C-methyl-D-erythritol 4-phosphate cytidylyltransferase n=2 Tax=Candidatus Litorirhabdus singularis TaxID=2518993 RepID=A0ABT3TIP1_9GAMM|nr:2-C-methyl-D-erythritol 4-phosphate cytidylyltransferase [Candidatus Litorirhabdus singularis]
METESHLIGGNIKYWGVVPAAGIGSRMGAEVPKQYLPLAGSTVLEQTLHNMLGWGMLSGITVALHPQDRWWHSLELATNPSIESVTGGEQRCDSVLAALIALEDRAAPMDWVLVHDAARPCVRGQEVRTLCEAVADDAIGGLLALPVAETVKRSDASGRVSETLDRTSLWLAQTPQMFRYAALRESLAAAIAGDDPVTDEAAALERAGHRPLLVAGHRGNLKITRPEDLTLAAIALGSEDK